jgi:hypothetical protein
VADWGKAITAAREQSDAAFMAVNALVRDRQIEYARTQPTLKESLFHPGLDSESVRLWLASLDALSAYAGNIAKLVDPAVFGGTGASAASMAKEITALAKLDLFTKRPGLADAITKIGDAVAGAAARATAQKIVAKANPAVQDLLSQMGRMLAEPAGDVETGMIPTVITNWNVRLGELQVRFLAPNADKAAIARQYATDLASRDSAVATLRGLKTALERLAESHAELAQGHSADTASMIAQIQEYTKLARSVLEDLKKSQAGNH